MRSELKKARIAEAEAKTDKKELTAKLSHDIKTPVASIKAASEVGAALEELRQLTVAPSDMASCELNEIFESADYLHRGSLPQVPDCLLYADRLRLQQVFDNLFANSYKYAGTKIDLSVSRQERFLAVTVEDFGGGVKKEELPLLKEKFKRGTNAENIEGAGLGLYISDYFMKEMHGRLLLENGAHGLKATVYIAYSG